MKRQGWQYEGWRHSLAAKGIKTNNYFAKKSGVSEKVKKENMLTLKKWTMPSDAEVFVKKSSGKVVAAYDKKRGVGEAVPDAELKAANKSGVLKVKNSGKYYASKPSQLAAKELTRDFEESEFESVWVLPSGDIVPADDASDDDWIDGIFIEDRTMLGLDQSLGGVGTATFLNHVDKNYQADDGLVPRDLDDRRRAIARIKRKFRGKK